MVKVHCTFLVFFNAKKGKMVSLSGKKKCNGLTIVKWLNDKIMKVLCDNLYSTLPKLKIRFLDILRFLGSSGDDNGRIYSGFKTKIPSS